MDRHYFDWAATAIPDPALNALPPFEAFGNPSSLHREGRAARVALEDARSRCAAVLGVPAKHLIFTSGGSESNALVIHSLALRKSFTCFLSSAVEHSSVRENCAVLEDTGKKVGFIAVNPDGRVSPETLDKALEKYPDCRFAAIMAVNNETGAVMDMPLLTARIRSRHSTGERGPPVHIHSDLVQAAGKTPLDIIGWDLDSASFSAHKLGGPRGIGLLYLKKPLEALYTGGGQESGIRPGTENTHGALMLAEVLERRAGPGFGEAYSAAALRWKRLIRGLKEIDRCSLIPSGRDDADRGDIAFSPWILQAAFKDIPGEVMVRALDGAGFALSTGSACASREQDRPVLSAMGLPDHKALEGLRFSQGWSTTDEEIDLLLDAIREALKFL
ncbi:aminotransferase V [Spirochaetia bacterium]|nr:aminotransferase V [Spirochaetia bacterium]